MSIFIHIVIALLSIGTVSMAFVKMSRKLLVSSYILTVLTLLSGIFLVVIEHSSLLHTCMSGISYLAIVTTAQIVARRHIVAHNIAVSK